MFIVEIFFNKFVTGESIAPHYATFYKEIIAEACLIKSEKINANTPTRKIEKLLEVIKMQDASEFFFSFVERYFNKDSLLFFIEIVTKCLKCKNETCEVTRNFLLNGYLTTNENEKNFNVSNLLNNWKVIIQKLYLEIS